MTTILSTISHGDIESGFDSWHIDFVKFGDYFFMTRDFCTLLKQVADNPKSHRFTIPGHPISELGSELMDDTKRAFAKFLKVDESAVTMSKETVILDSRRPDLIKVTNVESPDSFKGMQIQVRTSERNGKIEVGKYTLSGPEFSLLAYSVTTGGFAGWGEKAPQFASEALKAIDSGNNPLFKSLVPRQKKRRSRVGT